jgi:hypothetical protein
MCYSPEASFVVGSGLAVVGITTIKKALRYNRSMLLFSLFPAIFSLHQLIEGFVWLSVGGAFDGQIFRYLYILVAVLLWPFLTPLASALAEPDPGKRAARLSLFVAGLVLTAYLAFKLANATGIDVKVVGHSLSYVIGYDAPLPMFIHYAYAAIAIIPLVTLRNRALNVIGILVAASFLYTFLEMKEVWHSVWCLAAAASSVLFFFSIRAAEAVGPFEMRSKTSRAPRA